MKRTVQYVLHLALLAGAIFANFNAWAATPNPCPDADGVNKVNGQLECLVIQTTPNKHKKASTTLMVYLHGDSSRGGMYDRHFKHFSGFANQSTASNSVVFVGMIRPGYADSNKTPPLAAAWAVVTITRRTM